MRAAQPPDESPADADDEACCAGQELRPAPSFARATDIIAGAAAVIGILLF
jgi:hypothetical protein